MEQFYYCHQKKVYGPIPLEFIEELRKEGVLTEKTLVRHETAETWERLANYQSLPHKPKEKEPDPNAPPPPPSGKDFPPNGQTSVKNQPELNVPRYHGSPSRNFLVYRGIFALGLATAFVGLLFIGAALLEKTPPPPEDQTSKPAGARSLEDLESQQKVNHLAQTRRILESLQDLRNLRWEVQEQRIRHLEANVVRAENLFTEPEILDFYNNLSEDLAMAHKLLLTLREIETALQAEREQSDIFAKRMQRAEILDKIGKLENSFASYETYLQDSL
ncbi:MAG: DUF4339 domain-containing protein [Opitutales bacterium]|nr:DUF4339 domain-containing protein [Opitutales bacterium]